MKFYDSTIKHPFGHNYISFYGIDKQVLNDYKVEKIKEGNEETAVHVFEPVSVKGTVLLIHGYFDHTGSLKNMINFFLKKHWRVISYDLQGHGLSSGNRGEISDFIQYVETLKKVLTYCQQSQYKINSVIAHSTGAAIISYFLLQSKASFEKVIFLAPLVRPTKWRFILAASKIVPYFKSKLNRKFKINSGDNNYLDFVKKDPLQSKYISINWVKALIKWNQNVEELSPSTQDLYVIQGTLDQTVDWKYNVSYLKKKFPKCQVAIVEGCRHQIINDHQTIKNKVFKIIEKQIFS
ncbi:hypothetical protein BKP45_14605 [Anaerobacillus alkalidiazotrophicus]|uniref:Serine aminopeptidase S33 domain-containing protein n=1 Tax=Anaerobacillus alkalidiazotrophicus TaxID=472963 RepID=A0A1S2M5P6_9BACI|nr:alpha/beta hydrolase [Anaerobacillus alkalidiazotrophicus]OIJ18955.1 hypothetical protein BKP45_14605 [Anaerobacillus alkalidiazotrophicus]